MRRRPVPGYLRGQLGPGEGAAVTVEVSNRRVPGMSSPMYLARAKVKKIEGVHRSAEIATGVRFEMGVHGAIKEHYRLEGKNLPLPVDYIVAATGG